MATNKRMGKQEREERERLWVAKQRMDMPIPEWLERGIILRAYSDEQGVPHWRYRVVGMTPEETHSHAVELLMVTRKEEQEWLLSIMQSIEAIKQQEQERAVTLAAGTDPPEGEATAPLPAPAPPEVLP